MPAEEIGLAVLWHMHQPDYRNPDTGIAEMPWVRLHSAKDYVDMGRILEEFPKVRQTFNLTPVLVEQLMALGEGGGETLMNWAAGIGGLGPGERLGLVEQCLMAKRETQIEPYPRYAELHARIGEMGAGRAAREMRDEDLRDLVALYHLAWTDQIWFDRFPELSEMRAKGRDFLQEEILRILEIHLEAVRQVIPTYRDMARRGSIELSTSPYFHPIGPLLLDQQSAREAMPDLKMPGRGFRGEADLDWQIREAISLHERVFGMKPRGMWPPEGGIGQEFLEQARKNGFSWVASDDRILARARGQEGNKRPLLTGCYKAHNSSLNIVYRDSFLSDRLNFEYAGWEPQAAARDIIRISLEGAKASGNSCCAIILDGENAWDSYPADGRPFLRALLGALSNEPRIRCCTFSEATERYMEPQEAGPVIAGSWIDANFAIWIGHEQDRISWELLAQTREALLEEWPRLPQQNRQKAWRLLMAAEGSDWNWWYGDENPTGQRALFDKIYRDKLSAIYGLIGRAAPERLSTPI